MYKKISIASFLILLAVAGFFYFSPKEKGEVAGETLTLQLKKVLDEEVISPIGSYDSQSIWYFNSEGRLFQTTTDGQNLSEFPLSSLPGKGLIRALWPKKGLDFITITRDNQSIKSFYDSANKVFINLSSNVGYTEWMPDGKRILYIWKAADGKSQQLVMADADGSGYKIIADVFWPDLILKVSDDGKTALMYRAGASDVNKIYAANLGTGEITTIIDQGKNTAAMWLRSNSRFLYEQNSKIYVHDLSKKQSIDLKLPTSLNKVVVDSADKYLYAAVSNGSGDSFVRIDLSSLKMENYFEPNSSLKIKEIFLVGNTIYFVGNDSKLYNITK